MACWKITLLTICIVLMVAGPGLAIDRVVNPEGTGEYETIDDAVGACNNGDRVLLLPGVYTGQGNRNIAVEATITIEPLISYGEVVIDCEGSAATPRKAFYISDGWPIFRDLTITGGYDFNGGAIDVQTYTPTFENCRFIGNQAERGGAIYAAGADSVIVEQCLFAENRGTVEGGAVYAFGEFPVIVNQSTFYRNSSRNGSSFYRGGNSSLELSNSILALGRGDLAVASYYGGPVIATACDIWGNADGDWTYDLASQLNQSGNISADPLFCDPGADVPNFKVTSGSPASLSLGFTMGSAGIDLLWDVPFYSVRGDGSGMFPNIQAAIDTVPVPAEVVLETGSYYYMGNNGLEFRGKDITVRSRAMDPAYVRISALHYSDRVFWLHEGETTAATISHVTIETGDANHIANHTGYGGGILLSDGASATVRECVFEGNDATHGAAIAVNDVTSSLVLEGGLIGLNYGPEIFFAGRNLAASGTTFVGFEVGDGLCLEIDDLVGSAILDNCSFSHYNPAVSITGSTSSSVAFTTCNFEDGDSALVLDNVANITLTDCTITGSRGGGAITAVGTNLTISGGTFSNNDGLLHPGGFLNAQDSYINIGNAQITGNGSDQNGGAIYSLNSALRLTGCDLVDNVGYDTHIDPTGAGIFHSGGAVYLTACRFNGNTSAWGAAAYVEYADFYCTNSEFVGNSSYGSILIVESGGTEAILTNNLFAGNVSTGEGTLFLVAPNVTFTGSTVVDNSSVSYRAQVLVAGAADLDFSHNVVAFGAGGAGLLPTTITGTWDLSCNDIYGNEGGDYFNSLASYKNLNGNFTADPFFCDAAGGVYTVMQQSKCLAANNSCGAEIGVFGEGCQTVSGAPDAALPPLFTLHGNVPNPFNPRTEIRFSVPGTARVEVVIHDIAGRRVATLVSNGEYPAGEHQIPWNGIDHAGRHVPSGTYFYRVTTGGRTETGKMALLR
ncbi:MAG: right-handed parallel beta-helix repeat-containing protein [Candidatus Krumholzibacteria bacterium]|nr:right-handed parallel beta-helix repeat-containing protein [Candidatus Krumholzibacteria bacterium]